MKYRYKPQGSEKITDLNEKAKRIAELAGITESKKTENKSLSTTGRLSNVLHEVEAPNGKEYAIVKENKYVYVKEKIDGNYEYIGGVQNIKEHSHKNYAAAMRSLNLMIKEINDNLGLGNMDIFTGKKKTLK